MKELEKAYWISPYGKIMGFTHNSHIALVADNPQGFGFSKARVEKWFAKYNEPLKHEGYAREEIIIHLIKRGWTRIRYYYLPDRWKVNLLELNPITIDFLRGFANLLCSSGASLNEECWIDTFKNPILKLSLREIMENKLQSICQLPVRKIKYLINPVKSFKKMDWFDKDLTIDIPAQINWETLNFMERLSLLGKYNKPLYLTNGVNYRAICQQKAFQKALQKITEFIAHIQCQKLPAKRFSFFERWKRWAYWEKYIPPSWYGFDSIPDNWMPIIIKVLKFIEHFDPYFEIHQIKLKFGGLRFYVYTGLETGKLFKLLEKKLQDERLIY